MRTTNTRRKEALLYELQIIFDRLERSIEIAKKIEDDETDKELEHVLEKFEWIMRGVSAEIDEDNNSY